MKPRLISCKDFPNFLSALAKEKELWAPVKLKDTSGSRFARIRDAQEICFDFLNTKLPLKELFFPQREALFSFPADDPCRIQPSLQIPDRIVLGVRPCDTAALLLLDRVFLDHRFLDPYYQERRRKTILIGLACNEPGPACFCTALLGDPHGTKGLDILLVDLGEKYLAQPLTPAGEELAAQLPEAKAADLTRAEKLKQTAVQAMKFALDLAELKTRLEQSFDHEIWEELALPCVNCGVCTYVCPTCHCFDVTDEKFKGPGARLRTWDSCQFSLFTRHASGHNPRPAGKDRLRQRTLHKFRYFPQTHSDESCSALLMLCVGCGRCILECPAGIDLKETLITLTERLEPGR